MGYYNYVQEAWKNPKENLGSLFKQRLIEWRKGNSITRVEHPTRIDKARRLGYKAKQGYIVVRVKLPRGGRMRARFHAGRKSKKRRRKLILEMNYQWVAEQRANKKYPNCEVINSYHLAKDGRYYYFEVLLIDRELGEKYPEISGLAKQRGRVYRGLTSAARKSRALMGKGKGYEKARPSLAAYYRRVKS